MIDYTSDTRVTPIDAWSIYTALNLHFNPEREYDAIKYNFKGPKCDPIKFTSNKNKFQFEKLVKKYPNKNDIIRYCLANILEGKKWIADCSEQIYAKWSAHIQALDYKFKEDMTKLSEYAEKNNLTFDQCMINEEDFTQIPIIYKLYQGKSITLETLTCLNFLMNFVDRFDKKLVDPLGVSQQITFKIRKYTPFLQSVYQPKKYTDTIINLFTG